jgi:ATP-dependent DNA helicase RecG
VVAVLKQNVLRPPGVEEIAGTFRVTLFNGLDRQYNPENSSDIAFYRKLGLNPRQIMALVFLAKNLRINNHDYQQLCPDVHMETLRRDFADLVSRGLLIKVGDKRATYYIMKKRFSQEEL